MMTATNHDSLTRARQSEMSHDYPDVLFQELDIFRPSPALETMNLLLSAVPVDLGKLGKAVQAGSALAEEAVKLCNSSLFALSRPVSSLEQAVVATDADLVRTLLLTCWLTKLTGSRVARHENQMFWAHSLLVAQISRRINDWAGLAQPEQAFLAGLLHDAGALPFLTLLSSVETARHPKLFESLSESIDSQRARFKTDHCELGQRVSTILDFPLPLAEVVSRHHQRKATFSSSPLLRIVGCAEAVAQFCCLCTKQELPEEAVGPFVKDALRAWLPNLSPSANLLLLGALKSDLLGNIRAYGQSAKSASDDSFSRPEAHAVGPRGASAGG